jgi:hypothetical protein
LVSPVIVADVPLIVADVPRNSTQREILNPAAGSRTGFDGG